MKKYRPRKHAALRQAVSKFDYWPDFDEDGLTGEFCIGPDKDSPQILTINSDDFEHAEKKARRVAAALEGLNMKRDHEYLYTVDLRGKDGQWRSLTVKATSMVEVSRLLKIKLDDLRYVYKVIVK